MVQACSGLAPHFGHTKVVGLMAMYCGSFAMREHCIDPVQKRGMWEVLLLVEMSRSHSLTSASRQKQALNYSSVSQIKHRRLEYVARQEVVWNAELPALWPGEHNVFASSKANSENGKLGIAEELTMSTFIVGVISSVTTSS